MMRKRKYILSVLLCAGACVALITGCGGQYAGVSEGDAVSGSAVSGDAVSGDAIGEKTVSGGAMKEQSSVGKKRIEKDTYRFATDTNYYCDPKEGNAAIWQYRLDATKKKEIPLPHKDVLYSEVICVEDGFLYYYIINPEKRGKGSAGSQIFRVPLKKDKRGYDIVDIDGREEILSDAGYIEEHGVYMTSRYICYLRMDQWCYEWWRDKKVEVVKYDRKTGKKLPAETLPTYRSEDPEEECDELELCGYGDMLFVIDDHEVCFQKPDETVWNKTGRKDFYYLCYNGDALFDAGRNENGAYTEIYKYDLSAGQWQGYVSEQELTEAVNTALGFGKAERMECLVNHMSCWGDRLYIDVIATWREGEETHYRSLFFSKGEEDRTVCYERGLGECVRSHVTTNEVKLVDDEGDGKPVVLEDAGLSGMINGNVFLSFYDYEKDEGRLGCYELSTGEFRWLAEEDAEYYEMCYGTHNDWQNYGYLPIYDPTWSSFDNILEGVLVLR